MFFRDGLISAGNASLSCEGRGTILRNGDRAFFAFAPMQIANVVRVFLPLGACQGGPWFFEPDRPRPGDGPFFKEIVPCAHR
jgi:hypothetical protein